MPRKGSNATRWTTGRVFAVGVALMFTALFIFGGPLQFLYETYGPDWMRVKPGDLPEDSQPVDLSVGLWVDLHDIVPGTAVPVDIYDTNKVLIETRNSDTTTGIVSFQFDFWEGETVYVQAYVAGNAATGLTYMSPLLQFVVPEGDVNGDAQLATIHLQEPSSSTAAPTITVTDQAGNPITTGVGGQLNATDTAINILLNTVTGNTVYGLPTNVHDYRTGFDYLNGYCVVITTNGSLPFNTIGMYDSWEAYGTGYYVWHYPMIQNDGAIPSDGTINMNFPAILAFTLDAGITNVTITIDVFDWVRLTPSGGLDSNSFMDFDISFTVAVLNTYCE